MHGSGSFVIRILIVDGNPNGIRIVTRSNWDGYGAIVPRSMLDEAQKNSEVRQILEMSGIYILRAFSLDGALPTIYIGEADSVLERLLKHAEKPPQPEVEEWVDSLIFVSPELNKAHTRYIEAKLIRRAASARQAHLSNKNSGFWRGKLNFLDRPFAEGFINFVIQCLESLNINYFATSPRREFTDEENLCVIRQRSAEAYGLYEGSAFWVKADSMASKIATSGCPPRYKELREQLIREGVLEERDNNLVFTEDYRFDSPSAAAAVVLGRAANGWQEWKHVCTGKTLDELIRARISTAQSEHGELRTEVSSGTLTPSEADEAGGDL